MTANFFTDFPTDAQNGASETFETVVAQPNVRIERIISTGQSSPPNFWYCQAQSEWVMVVQGCAGLQFDEQDDVLILRTGDFVNIPAQRKHRVAWTDSSGPTIWLAVHYGNIEKKGVF
ncbi:nif11 domain/cupin domain protein [Leminorella richardii]|uniref:Nif11 domain/cupin domain protein n=1 Tax=Leminorella richardii TaxID=158841 RepID=A0A2X4XWD6_9GAMM|nr:cupin domain-containing protein [Leminorella richardii]SQI40944.1 nif11 domain/cupin domain protein [Leminorella richardii]